MNIIRISLVINLLLISNLFGQINIPEETESYQPIVANIDYEGPDEAVLTGRWEVDENVKYVEIDKQTIHIWAKPGSHSLKYIGYWIHTKDVKITDVDKKEIIVNSYVGSGLVLESIIFVVTPEITPNPIEPSPIDPIDPIAPPTPLVSHRYQIMFFVEAEKLDTLPKPQRELITSLKIRRDLISKGHTLKQVIDNNQITDNSPNDLVAWINSVKNEELPRMSYALRTGGPIINVPLPENYEALLFLLEGAK